MRGNSLEFPVAKNTKARLLAAGTKLIAEHGLAGASVRDICAEAEAGRNMIHHYFGSKDGLYQAILEDFSSEGFAPAIRTIETPAQSAEEFRIKLELFLTETLEALVARSLVFRIMTREREAYLPLKEFRGALVTFLQAAQESGLIHEVLNVDMIPGHFLDRLGNQVLYALTLGEDSKENIIADPTYRREWLKANTQLLLFGIASKA